MTDYTQMTDTELSDALMEIDAIQGEVDRRNRLGYAARQIAEILFQVERDQGEQIDVLIEALGMTQQDLDPFGSGDGWDVPVINDEEAADVITRLQARIDAV